MPIHDAQTKPGGFGLSAERWPRDPRVQRIARARGFRIPAPQFVAMEAPSTYALLNHGVWRAWCPDCLGQAEDLWRDRPFFCMRCGNKGIGGSWRPVVWPERLAEIEAALDPFPAAAQNWEPWGEAVDLEAAAAEWVAHAAVMLDPEHGLTENEVGGADDPETYTVPVLAVTNAIITSSDANVDKGDLRFFRQYLSADPAASGKFLLSSGANAAGWTASTSLAVNLATSGTLASGALTVTGAASISGAVTPGSYAGGSQLAGVPSVLGMNVGTSGILMAASSTIAAQAITATTVTASGAVSAGSYAGGSTSSGSPSVKGLTVGTDGVSIGSGGSGPLVVAGSVTPGSYAGGSTSAGSPSMLGISLGTSGMVANAGPVAGTTGTLSGALSAGSYTGGSTSAGTPSFKGLVVGTDGAAIGSGGSGSVTIAGSVTPGSYAGGSTSAGSPSVKGLTVGTDGVAIGSGGAGSVTVAGSVSPGSYAGGSTSAGTPSVLGLNVGASGIALTGASTQIALSATTGTAPMTVASTTKVTNLNVDQVDGAHASTTPSAGIIPIADGSGQIAAGFIPASVGTPLIGEIRLYATATMTVANAAGWYLCDGSAVSRTTHASLFSVIGTTYGPGNGSTTFNLPDFRGRFPMGVSGSHALATTGGAETVDDRHTHSIAISNSGVVAEAGSGAGLDLDTTVNLSHGGTDKVAKANHTHAVNSATQSGGSAALAILNPFIATEFIIYSGV